MKTKGLSTGRHWLSIFRGRQQQRIVVLCRRLADVRHASSEVVLVEPPRREMQRLHLVALRSVMKGQRSGGLSKESVWASRREAATS